MNEQTTENLHRRYDLVQERKYPSKKVPASHQSEALDKLHHWFRANISPAGGILVLPTGGGKTFVGVRFLCSEPLSQGYKVLWLAHTHHLLEQAFYSFAPPNQGQGYNAGNEVGRITEPKPNLSVRVVSGTPGHFPVHQIKPDDDVIIATLQTITRAYNDSKQTALRDFLNSSKGKLFVVFDEAHHSPAPSYRKLLTDMRTAYPSMSLLGLTATPTYSDEKKQGWLVKLFPQKIIYQVSPQLLMANNILAKPLLEEHTTQFTPEFDEREYQQWMNTYRDLPEHIINQLAENRERNAMIAETYVKNRQKYGKTIVFADRWFQCEALRTMFRDRNVRADVIYSHIDADPGNADARNKRKKDENAQVLEAFRQNQLDVLINVRMLTEGTDVPDVQSVFLTRQTTSRILLTQMVGRALRGPLFGGTDVAYIVAFSDHWKQMINWADYDQLDVGRADDTVIQYGQRPPLQLVSIEIVRQLARQMDSGLNITPGPFLTLMPIGWYRTEYETLSSGTDQIEDMRQLVMVFQHEQQSYEQFIEYLKRSDLCKFVGESLESQYYWGYLERWQHEFFVATENTVQSDLTMNLLHIVRHMAQNENEPPEFFEFRERDNHDLDQIANHYINQNLGTIAINQALMVEYQRLDRYWKSIYYNYDLFKSQYDACVNRIIRSLGDIGKISPPIVDKIKDREPSDELKEQVKKRDNYTCLCCGENNTGLLQIDHVAPSYYGGNNSLENLQTLCRICNQTKGVNELNFMTHSTLLTGAPSNFEVFQLIEDSNNFDQFNKSLHRCINFFYRCAAVESTESPIIGIRKSSPEWHVRLYSGNNPGWLESHLKPILRLINEARQLAGSQPIKSIRISAPDQTDVIIQDLSPVPLDNVKKSSVDHPDAVPMLEELKLLGTTHERRAFIGVDLARIGDPRPGVGLRPDGLPDIVWRFVSGGTVTLVEGAGTFRVEPFYIAQYPITYRQYRAFLEAPDGYHNPVWWRELAVNQPLPAPGLQSPSLDNHPAVSVAWVEAVAFCRWLSHRRGDMIRLPTEWEWQQAATGGNPSNVYPWGPEWHRNRANTRESRLNRPTAVGMYPKGASPVGALDMAGNVWELCLNEYTHPERTDVTEDAARVVRGGSWSNSEIFARTMAFRPILRASFRDSDIGFRVVRAAYP